MSFECYRQCKCHDPVLVPRRVLCISTSFWVLHAPKSWSKHINRSFLTSKNEIWNHQFSLEKVINQQKNTEISQKTLKKVKNHQKKDNFEIPPQGVNQLLYVDQLWGVDKITFFCSFSDVFLLISACEITEKGWKWKKRLKTAKKK